jgi:hypothetical protein
MDPYAKTTTGTGLVNQISGGNTFYSGTSYGSGWNGMFNTYNNRYDDSYRNKIYYDISQLEKPKLEKLEYSIENLNNMLTSLDIDSRNMAIDIICVNTKYLGLYLKAAIRNEEQMLEQVIDQFLKDRYCTLL